MVFLQRTLSEPDSFIVAAKDFEQLLPTAEVGSLVETTALRTKGNLVEIPLKGGFSTQPHSTPYQAALACLQERPGAVRASRILS